MYFDLNPWNEFERLERDMQTLFDRTGYAPGRYAYPLTNIYENKDDLQVVAELPGLDKSQVNLTYNDGVLTLAGELPPYQAGKNAALIRQERASGRFEKSLRLPVAVKADQIQANFKDGLLSITLPKAEEAKPKQIAIHA